MHSMRNVVQEEGVLHTAGTEGRFWPGLSENRLAIHRQNHMSLLVAHLID